MIKDYILKLTDALKLYEDMAFRKSRIVRGFLDSDSSNVLNDLVTFKNDGVRVKLFNQKYLTDETVFLTWEEFQLSDEVLKEHVEVEKARVN